MRRALLAAGALLAACPAPAAAQQSEPTVRGVTEQGRQLTFRLTSAGAPTGLAVEWDARCRGGTRFAPQTTTFVQRGDTPPPPTVIAGTGRYRIAERGGRIASVRVVIAGRRRGDPARPETHVWSGVLRVRATMRRHGRLSDRCSITTRWRAGAEGFGAGAWDLASDIPTDPEPRAWRHDPATATMKAFGTRDAVSVESRTPSETWTASFRAPTLNRLEQGRTYTTDSDVPGAATMSVDGPFDSDCSSSGSFVVERIAFDRLRRLSVLRLRFELRCSGTVRGVVDWRARP